MVEGRDATCTNVVDRAKESDEWFAVGNPTPINKEQTPQVRDR